MREPSELRVEGLTVSFGGGAYDVVRGVSFSIQPGEAYGLVGESGSGKTMTARAILGLTPNGAEVSGGIYYGDRDLTRLSYREMRSLRGSTIGMVFQDPSVSLNPLLRVGRAIAQVIQSHDEVRARDAREQAVELMSHVGIRDARRRARSYPHEFSGGMQQRIAIAMALAARPTLLLADEPTTALDVMVQAGILRLLDRLRREEAMSLLLVSHDFGVIAGMCERVGVMYAGELVEEGPVREVLFRPAHPYTRGLLESLPEDSTGRLTAIPGSPPEFASLPEGCAFSPRCAYATAECTSSTIALHAAGEGHSVRCIHAHRLGVWVKPERAPSAKVR